MTDAAPLTIAYPPDLPVTARREDLLAMIAEHQVVVVAGETGSGKSTQLPKFCLELGRGIDGLIGHTQPRRLAARSVAERIAEELDSRVGGVVGYTVRFTDEVGPETRLKLMTDGILLAEIQRDRMLRRYDTIIVDEAHERSLNIDFLLGYLKRLLPERPDLKLIITSATIDTERIASHFDDAPVVEVSGRTWPVEMRWRDDDEKRSQPERIADAVQELIREGPGDVLVFLSGEADIRDAEQQLRGLHMADTEIFPLYARLSAAEQHRVFEPHTGRRVVLSTNVAETSLTVPGIRYVVDPGNARISRYSFRTKVQRLPIEEVSQASANQRAGRCGRVGPGVCIRLYSEENYESRPEFTEPEIQRTNLASVILQMASLGLGDVAEFPFVDPPDERSIRDGIALLTELGAVNPDAPVGTRKWLTPLGRTLGRLPVDPRLARIVVEADRNACLDEVLIIVAGLSVIDPRERPRANRAKADETHLQWTHENSDFLSWLELWAHLEQEERARSSNQFRRWCRSNHLHYMRIREWRSVHGQLRRVCRELKLRGGSPAAEPDQIHRSIVTGFLSQIGMRDPARDEYRGARGARLAIAPGSTLHRRSPDWIVAGELVETSRLWARMVTRIRPEWAEDAAEHLVERSYGEPWWAPDRGSAYADERVTLYGLPLVAGRPVSLSQIDRATARDMFIHHALIEGEWDLHFPFIEHNAEVLRDVEVDQARRRRDVLVNFEALHRFYDERLGPDVVSARAFENWWRKARKDDPQRLHLTRDAITDTDAPAPDPDAFPDTWTADGVDLDVEYEFDPTSETDGVTVTIPVSSLNQMRASDFEWNVPGIREELVTALIRTMPKELRKLFVPVPQTVADVLPRLNPDEGGLLDGLRRELSRRTTRELPLDALSLDRVEPRLRPNFRVVGDDGRTLAESRSLEDLDVALDRQVRDAIQAADTGYERTGMTTWECGELPLTVETDAGGHRVRAHPALADEGDTVGVRMLPTAAEAERSHRAGLRRLLTLALPSPNRVLKATLDNPTALVLGQSPYDSLTDFIVDCQRATLTAIIDEHAQERAASRGAEGAAEGAAVRDAVAFDELAARARDVVADRLDATGRAALAALTAHADVLRHLRQPAVMHFPGAVEDIRDHLDRLVYSGFVTRVGVGRLADVDRYLRAIGLRIEKLAERRGRDARAMAECQRLERDVYTVARHLDSSPELTDLLWKLEEFRVSQFAQQLGTRGTVSEKRIRAALADLTRID